MNWKKYILAAGVILLLTETALGSAVREETLKPMSEPLANRPEAQRSMTMRTDYAREVMMQVNGERAKLGLAPLAYSEELNRAARVRVEEIARKFSHTRPDGRRWSTVSSAARGENIAKGHGWPDRVMAAWMTSDGHRKNIQNPGFGSIGVCAAEIDGILYWVQLFGR